MTITVLTGLPGSGKTSTLIRQVLEWKARDLPVLTFACRESKLLSDRKNIQVHRILCSRIPGLTCDLNHFVSTDEAVDILDSLPPQTLVAFEEAQFFQPRIVDAWTEAASRGVEVCVACPSQKQLSVLGRRGIRPTTLDITCQMCDHAPADRFFIVPGEDQTMSVCIGCYEQKLTEVRAEVIQALQENAPYPGEKTVYQPVEFPETRGWKVLRPDSQTRVKLMTEILNETGITESPAQTHTYLDMGCNTGFFCHHMSRLGLTAEGVDVVWEDIDMARTLDSYFRRDHAVYIARDAREFLESTPGRQYDITSAYSVFQWVMIQQGTAVGTRCVELLFEKTRRICFLEMGYSEEEHYKDQLDFTLDRAWTRQIMESRGGFDEIRLVEAGTRKLKRDIFIGIKNRPPAA